ncbi:MAG: tetratricopeptide repeat protein [Myxococcales bacterium]
MRIPVLLAFLLAAAAASAGVGDALHKGQDREMDGDARGAAIAFHQALQRAQGLERAQAELLLAQSLARLGLPASASVYYLRVLDRGPADPFYARALEGAVASASWDGAPMTALEKAPAEAVAALPPDLAARLHASLALSAWRAGRYADAARFADRVAASSPLYPRARYLTGLLSQRADPQKALGIFAGIRALEGDGYAALAEVKQLATLAAGRVLFALGRYGEASAAYASVPRFSRHWDEALFEGAYADLRGGDPGAALGKLHTLRSPQLSDEYAPEADQLAAVIYHRNCLWPQVRETLAKFAARYLPMRDRVKSFLERNPAADELAGAVEAGDSLPAPVRRRVRKNERVEAMLAELRRIDAERRKVGGDAELMRSALGSELADVLGKRHAAAAIAAGELIRERLAGLTRLANSLDGDIEIVVFETLKGEKEFLEERIDIEALLAAQKLYRPAVTGGGSEYWQFDGEYWPDEVGYYRYTVKDACPAVQRAAAAEAAPAPAVDDAAHDAAIDRKRDEMIAQLQRILPKLDEGTRKAELSFQLAELWWEKAKSVALHEVREYDQRTAAWLGAREKDDKSAGPEPKVSTVESDRYRKEALAIYQTILRDSPDYPRRDELLFVLAYNQYEIGDRMGALRSYQALIEQFPGSRYVPDAYVQIGEHHFQHNDLARSRAAFEKAASFRLPKIYGFAVYKLAWCDYNAHDFRGAIAKFQEVVDYSERQAGGKDRDRIQLKNEALKDIVLPFAQLDAVEAAAAYLTEKGGSRGVELIDRLAGTYFDTGKFEQAVRVYRLLKDKSPSDARAAAWQQRILLAYDKLNRRDEVAREMERLVAGYGPRSAWAKANAGRANALNEAHDLTESALRELVQDYHQEAIKTKNAGTYRLARDIYKRYLDAFPDGESAYRLRFYYAEILYALEEWEPAGEQYARVADADSKGEYARKAAYDAVLALEKAVAIAQGKLQKRELRDAARVDEHQAKGRVGQGGTERVGAAAKGGQEEAIPELEQKLVFACERYLRLTPDARDEALIRYKAAYVLYHHRHYAEAGRRFGEIVERWPADPLAQKAADLTLDVLNSSEKWLPLSETAEKFHADARLSPAGSEFEKRVRKVAEGARFKHALEIYQKQNDPVLAAKEFTDFVARYPRSEYAPVALNDSVVIAEKADQLDLVIAAAEQLLNEYPGAPETLQKPATLSLAGAYERSARFADAVRWYERYAARWPNDPKAPDQLFNAALWREGLGDDAGALADWRRYVERYRARPDAARIAFNIGLLLERQKEWKKAADHWREFQRGYARAAAPGQLLLARYKEGLARREVNRRDAAAAAAFAEVAQRFARLPSAERTAAVVDAAAHARFLLVEPAFEEFASVRFTKARQAQLLAALKAKNARMAKLLAGYTEVIEAGSPTWSQAALTRLGEAYRDFNKGLLQAPTPRGLDAEQRELYRTTLENQALPLEDKAVEAFRKAIETSGRTGSYSEWTLRAQDRLREYRPDEVADRRQPALLSSAAKGVSPEALSSPRTGEGK